MEELHGKISLKLNNGPLVSYLRKHVTAYDPSRFEIVAVRFYYASELVLTVFARDLINKSSTVSEGRVPVKKFKIVVTSPGELVGLADSFNFTVCSSSYDLDEMEVINK
jgi:hypothetical protein